MWDQTKHIGTCFFEYGEYSEKVKVITEKVLNETKASGNRFINIGTVLFLQWADWNYEFSDGAP